jgi:hypothetical protein
MSEELNKILGQLEEDLKKLQSAREQVEQVVESNQKFAMVSSDLITDTKSLIAEIETITKGAIKQFSNKLTESKDAVDQIVKDSISQTKSNVKKVEEINQKMKETTETTVTKVSELAKSTIEEQRSANENIFNRFSEQLTETKDNLQTLFEKSKNDIEHVNQSLQENAINTIAGLSDLTKTSIQETVAKSLATIKDTSNLATKFIEEHKTENLKTLNQILETHNQIKKLIGQLLDLDLPKTLQSVNNNIEKLQSKNNEQFKSVKKMQIWSLVGLGIVVVLITIFKFLS